MSLTFEGDHVPMMIGSITVCLLVVAKAEKNLWILTAVAWLFCFKVGSFMGDGTVGIQATAGLLALWALPQILKQLVTVAATYPLANVFPVLSKILPKYVIGEDQFFTCDGCSAEVGEKRKAAIMELSEKWKKKYPKCRDFSAELKKMISDLRFTSSRCFPAFNEVVNSYLDPSMALDRTEGVDVVDIDGNKAMDISGSYGVNVCGYEQYKAFIEEGWGAARKQGFSSVPWTAPFWKTSECCARFLDMTKCHSTCQALKP